jgi:cytochrome c
MRNLIRHRSVTAVAVIAALSSVSPSTGSYAQTQSDGDALYEAKCSACHSLSSNKIGPAHRGVYGRKAGTVPGYAYSEALKGSNLVWNDANLDRWLQGPQKMVKGSKMFLAVPDPTQRKAIIAYLKSRAAR